MALVLMVKIDIGLNRPIIAINRKSIVCLYSVFMGCNVYILLEQLREFV